MCNDPTSRTDRCCCRIDTPGLQGWAVVQDSMHSVGDTPCACWSKQHEVQDQGRFSCASLRSLKRRCPEDGSTALIEANRFSSAESRFYSRQCPLLRTDQRVGTRRNPTVHRTSKYSGGEGTNYISAKYCLRLEIGHRNSARHNWGSAVWCSIC